MNYGPQGPVKEEAGAALRRDAAARALDSVLPTGPDSKDGPSWPRIEVFIARELPRLHRLQLPTYELAWILKASELDPSGYGVGLQFRGRDSARGLAAALRVVIERLDQIADAVERGVPVPPPPGAEAEPVDKTVDKSANPAKGDSSQPANPANEDINAGGGKLG